MTSRQRRKAERRWRRTGLAADLRAFKDLRNQSNNLLNVARKVFYKDLIDESSGERKKLFSVTKRLLGVERDTQYPPIKDKVVLNKIISLVIFSLRRLWSYKTSLIYMADSPVVQPMDSFRELNESEVQKLIEATPKKFCSLDPMPTPLVVGCIDILLPVIIKFINLSLLRAHLLINGSVR